MRPNLLYYSNDSPLPELNSPPPPDRPASLAFPFFL